MELALCEVDRLVALVMVMKTMRGRSPSSLRIEERAERSNVDQSRLTSLLDSSDLMRRTGGERTATPRLCPFQLACLVIQSVFAPPSLP